jgi:hypothetical protein
MRSDVTCSAYALLDQFSSLKAKTVNSSIKVTLQADSGSSRYKTPTSQCHCYSCHWERKLAVCTSTGLCDVRMRRLKPNVYAEEVVRRFLQNSAHGVTQYSTLLACKFNLSQCIQFYE